MKPSRLTRRQFVAATSLGSLAAAASQAGPAYANLGQGAGKLAVLGGKPVRTKRFSGWPIWDKENDEEQRRGARSVWSRSIVAVRAKYARTAWGETAWPRPTARWPWSPRQRNGHRRRR